MHLDDEQIQRVLHGELDQATQGVVRTHLATCPDCARRVADAKREEERIFALLRLVEGVPSARPVDAQTLVARARHAETTRRLRWAAGVALAFSLAGVAYAAPGSPLRAWVARMLDRPESHPEQGAAGIAVPPSDRFTIVFRTEQPRGSAAVSLTDESDVVARRLSGDAGFSTDVDGVTIENTGSTGDYEIRVPRDAPWVEIRVGERRVFLKDGPGIVTDAPVDARGRYLVPLRPSPPR